MEFITSIISLVDTITGAMLGVAFFRVLLGFFLFVVVFGTFQMLRRGAARK
jgi:hypothetical protein